VSGGLGTEFFLTLRPYQVGDAPVRIENVTDRNIQFIQGKWVYIVRTWRFASFFRIISWYYNRCIRVLATEIFETISVASLWIHGRGEKAQLSSGWISVGSELSSLNFNSPVRAEQSFAIRYPNVVIKSVCGNLDICLNYYANAYFWSWPKVKDAFCNRARSRL